MAGERERCWGNISFWKKTKRCGSISKCQYQFSFLFIFSPRFLELLKHYTLFVQLGGFTACPLMSCSHII